MIKKKMDPRISGVITSLAALPGVSNVRVVGSYTKGKKKPKDIDILLELNISSAKLEDRRFANRFTRKIANIMKTKEDYSLYDIFLLTSDGKKYRIQLWEDIDTGEPTWELDYSWS